MEEKQLEMDFLEEGLQTTEEEVDPVSGNEIPPGATAENVRDDIDAKLSDGEYVVPADVVKFFGVKFFEELREKAKTGMQKMDESGRINGEEAEEGDDELPFNDDELEMIDFEPEMAAGGLLNVPQAASANVAAPPQVDNVRAPQYTPAMASPIGPSALLRTSSTANVEWRDYVCDGQPQQFGFIGGTPITAIPATCRPAGDVEQQAPAEVPQPTPRQDVLRRNQGGGYARQNEFGDNVAATERAGGNRAGTRAFEERRESRRSRIDPANNPMRSREALEDWASSEARGGANIGTAIGGIAGAVFGGGLMSGIGGASKGNQMYDASIYGAAAQMAKHQGWDDLAEGFEEKYNKIAQGGLAGMVSTGAMKAKNYIEAWENPYTTSLGSFGPNGKDFSQAGAWDSYYTGTADSGGTPLSASGIDFGDPSGPGNRVGDTGGGYSNQDDFGSNVEGGQEIEDDYGSFSGPGSAGSIAGGGLYNKGGLVKRKTKSNKSAKRPKKGLASK